MEGIIGEVVINILEEKASSVAKDGIILWTLILKKEIGLKMRINYYLIFIRIMVRNGQNSLKNRFYSTLRRISNLDSKSKEKKTPKELLLYVPKVFENFKKTSNILKISDKRTFVDSLLNSNSNTIKNYQLSNSIDHRQLINKNYQEYQKLSENELEENIRDLCNSNPFIESIPIRVQINQKVDRFMDEFFTVDKKICQKFEFCAICKNPKDFNAEKEKKSLGSFAYEIEQLDEFMNDLKNLEKTIIENTKVIKLVNDIYEKRDL